MKQGIRNGHNREAKKKRDTAINEGKLRGTQWVNSISSNFLMSS